MSKAAILLFYSLQEVYSTPEWFSLSHDEIDQLPASFSYCLNRGVEKETLAKFCVA